MNTSRVIARLCLFAAYALFLLAENIMHFESTTNVGIMVATSVLWAALLFDYVCQMLKAANRSLFLRESIAYPLYLILIVFVTSSNPWLIAIPLIVGFILQLRRLAAGHAAAFALGLATFIVVLATFGVHYAEQSEPDSRLRDLGAAFTWSLARVIHLRGYDGGDPLSADGQALSFVIAIAGILVAALLTAELFAWIIGGKRVGESEERSPREGAMP